MGWQKEKKRRAHPGLYYQKFRGKNPGKEKPMVRENMSLPRQENGMWEDQRWCWQGWGHPGNSELPLWEAESAPCIFMRWMNRHIRMLYRQVRLNRANLLMTPMENWRQPMGKEGQKALCMARIRNIPCEAKEVPRLPLPPSQGAFEDRSFLPSISRVPA